MNPQKSLLILTHPALLFTLGLRVCYKHLKTPDAMLRWRNKGGLSGKQEYHHTCDGFSHFLRNSSLALARNSFTASKHRQGNGINRKERCFEDLSSRVPLLLTSKHKDFEEPEQSGEVKDSCICGINKRGPKSREHTAYLHGQVFCARIFFSGRRCSSEIKVQLRDWVWQLLKGRRTDQLAAFPRVYGSYVR